MQTSVYIIHSPMHTVMQYSHTYQRNVILSEIIGYAIKMGTMISVGVLCVQKVVEEAEI